jgi:hypothetical protein
MSSDTTYTPEQIINADFVWAWVDGTDSEWIRKHQYYTNEKIKKERYTACDEIIYSLLSYHKFMKWHKGRLIIVTDAQTPKLWKLPPELRQRVRIVDHKQFIPKQYLPTFNSSTIELWLPYIPTLSNVFVYWNDDFFVWKETPLTYFFDDSSGKLLGHCEKSKIVCRYDRRWVYGSSLQQTCDRFPDLINTKFTSYSPNHSPRIYDKRVLQQLHQHYREVVSEESEYKTRSPKQINTILLYDTWLNKQGVKVLTQDPHSSFKHAYVHITRLDILDQLDHNVNIVCINDSTTESNEKFEEKMKQHLEIDINEQNTSLKRILIILCCATLVFLIVSSELRSMRISA